MRIEVLRLFYATVDGFLGRETPIHGYVIKHPRGVVLVDTGVSLDAQYRFPDPIASARSVEWALADHDLSIADVRYLVNTHLDIDHAGQNVALRHIPAIMRRAELDWARELRMPHMPCVDFRQAKFDLLDDEDVEVLPGVTCLFTPGHTPGHQSVLVDDGARTLLVGDAFYTWDVWDDLQALDDGHRISEHQVRTSFEEWRRSAQRLKETAATTVHICHANEVRRHVGG